ncbi:MAG: SRPBCC domain-containing protein [Trueperaceae bacterium]|jgi:uncharacterized protein YndB with AHSA1/START domain
MQEPEQGSFTLTREFKNSPEVVFRAFSDPLRRRRWFVEGEGFIVDSHKLDFRVNGSETSAFRVNTPEFQSEEIRNNTFFLDIVPGKRIVSAYSMSNVGVPFSASLQTITFEAVPDGTRLTLVEQATFFEGADGIEMRRHGTEQLLDSLAKELLTSTIS